MSALPLPFPEPPQPRRDGPERPPPTGWRAYLDRMRGHGHPTLPRVSALEIVGSWVGAFLGIAALVGLGRVAAAGVDGGLLIGSMGASAVLVYGAPRSPFAQPRAVVGGHVVSAVVGVATHQLLPDAADLAAALAVATAIAAMHVTRTLHPPGGATALIAVVGSAELQALGFGYALVPVGLGAAALTAVGVVVNNVVPRRRYPEAWW